jgi:hypothetical protein
LKHLALKVFDLGTLKIARLPVFFLRCVISVTPAKEIVYFAAQGYLDLQGRLSFAGILQCLEDVFVEISASMPMQRKN